MSNKKNLLNEAQIRQFMKLASLEPLTPGFVHGRTERGSKAAGRAVLDELRTGRTGALGPKGGTANPGHGRGQGEAADGSLFQEEEHDLEADLGATEDELGAEDLEADEEGAEIDDLEGDVEVDVEGGGGRLVSVDDFLSALESTLEDFLDDEVEMDTSAMDDEEGAPPEEDEFAPEGDEVVADVEVEDELEEGVFGGKSKADKDREKLALGKKGSYAPDPEAGEKDYKPTPEEIAKARAEKTTSSRDKFPRGHSSGGGGMKIGGITGEGQEATDKLVEQITKRVAARILKSALAKKK